MHYATVTGHVSPLMSRNGVRCLVTPWDPRDAPTSSTDQSRPTTTRATARRRGTCLPGTFTLRLLPWNPQHLPPGWRHSRNRRPFFPCFVLASARRDSHGSIALLAPRWRGGTLKRPPSSTIFSRLNPPPHVRAPRHRGHCRRGRRPFYAALPVYLWAIISLLPLAPKCRPCCVSMGPMTEFLTLVALRIHCPKAGTETAGSVRSSVGHDHEESKRAELWDGLVMVSHRDFALLYRGVLLSPNTKQRQCLDSGLTFCALGAPSRLISRACLPSQRLPRPPHHPALFQISQGRRRSPI